MDAIADYAFHLIRFSNEKFYIKISILIKTNVAINQIDEYGVKLCSALYRQIAFIALHDCITVKLLKTYLPFFLT